jgi:hypothetical protein
MANLRTEPEDMDTVWEIIRAEAARLSLTVR